MASSWRNPFKKFDKIKKNQNQVSQPDAGWRLMTSCKVLCVAIDAGAVLIPARQFR